MWNINLYFSFPILKNINRPDRGININAKKPAYIDPEGTCPTEVSIDKSTNSEPKIRVTTGRNDRVSFVILLF